MPTTHQPTHLKTFQAPSFTLPDANDGMQRKSLHELQGKQGTMIIFMCNHCPYVLKVTQVLEALHQQYGPRGIQLIGINANDASTYPEDAPECMPTFAKKQGITFPYLHDASQDTAKAYQAVCTPDIFVFDQDLKLYHQGRLDGSTPRSDLPADGSDIIPFLDSLSHGQPAPKQDVHPCMGCSIKWK